MTFPALLDSFCDIRSFTSGADDGMGGKDVGSWTTIYWNVPCRFESLTKETEIQAYDKKTVFPDYYLYFEWRSGIKNGDRIFKNGRQFEIKLAENWSEQGIYAQHHLTEIGRGE